MKISFSEIKKDNEGLNDSEIVQLMFDKPDPSDKEILYDFEGHDITLDRNIYYEKREGRRHFLRTMGCTFSSENEVGFLPRIGEEKDFRGWRIGAGGQEKDISTYMDSFFVDAGAFKNVAFLLIGSKHAVFSKSKFYGTEIPVDGIFAMRTNLENCTVANFSKIGARLSSGEGYFINGTGDNSASNRSIIEKCEFLAGSNNPQGIVILDSDGVQIDNNILQGGTFKNHIFAECKYNTTRTINVRNTHIESKSTHASLDLSAKRKVIVEGLFNQMNSQVFRLNAPDVYLRDTSFVVLSEGCFESNSSNFHMNGVSNRFIQPYYWKDGLVPGYANIDNGAKKYYRRSLTEYFGHTFQSYIQKLMYYRDGKENGSLLNLKGFSTVLHNGRRDNNLISKPPEEPQVRKHDREFIRKSREL